MPTVVVIDDNDRKVTFEDSPELREKVFQAVLKFFKDNDSFSGESIMQMDEPQENAAPFLSDLADDFFKFEVEWKED